MLRLPGALLAALTAIAVSLPASGLRAQDLDTLFETFAGHFQKREFAKAAPLGRRIVEGCEKQFGPDHADCARHHYNLALTYARLKKHEDAARHFEQALRVRQKTLGEWHKDVGHTLSRLGASYEALGRYKEAVPVYKRVVAIRKKVLGKSHSNVAAALNDLAIVHESLGQLGEAIPLYEQALAIQENNLGKSDPEVGPILNNLAIVYEKQGQYEDAIRLYKRAVAIYRKAYGNAHTRVAGTLENLATLHSQIGKPEEAIALHKRVLAIREQLFGKSDLSVAKSLNLMATSYSALDRNRDAVPLFERVLTIREGALGASHADVAKVLVKLGDSYAGTGSYDAAIPVYERALGIYEQSLGRSHQTVASVLNDLAGAYASLSKAGKAIALYERSLKIWEAVVGKSHPEIGPVLNNLAIVYDGQARYEASIRLYRRALAIYENAYGKSHPRIAGTLNNLANAYETTGRYQEAIAAFERSLAIWQSASPPPVLKIAAGLNNLATVYRAQGRFNDAVPLLERSLSLRTKNLGEAHPDVATTLGNLGNIHADRGEYAKAVVLHERALVIREAKFGQSNPLVAASLNAMAIAHQNSGSYEDAIKLYRRALAIHEGRSETSHPDHALVLNNLASAYEEQNLYGDAVALYDRALPILEKAFGKSHPSVATALNNRGNVYRALGRLALAKESYGHALKILEAAFGPSHPEVAVTLHNMGFVHRLAGDREDALRLYRRALTITEETFGKSHPELVGTLHNIALLHGDDEKYANSLTSLRRAAAIAAREDRQASMHRKSRRRGAEGNDVFADLAWAAFGRSLFVAKEAISLADEAFMAAQRSSAGSLEAALTQMAVRVGAGDSALAKVVRRQQDLVREHGRLGKQLLGAISNAPQKRDGRSEQALRKERDKTRAAITEIDAELAKTFPGYAELTNPRPLGIAETRKHLGKDEAIVVYLVNQGRVYVWAVSRDNLAWELIDLKRPIIEKRVAELRQSLDPVASVQSGQRGFSRDETCRGLARIDKPCKAYDTDLEQAHRLYVDLLSPVERVIAGKRHLIVVPTGPLTGLPFHMLVTSPPPDAGKLADRFKKAQWLIRRQAVTVLPSVSSLKALRVLANEQRAPRPFIGIGDPVFVKPKQKKPQQTPGLETREFTTYFRGRLADVDRLSGAIPPLPDTADELRAVGKVLRARRSEIILGRKASERTVKSLNAEGRLKAYRVVHFATHGLVAGEIDGLAEPALALSLPSKAAEIDDGLLTASEVARLKLNADWVVLSACNTAAGDKPGAEALSGLARSFFYSGARALLVSHWPVVSEAAVQLTTKTFAALKADPAIGRAEALRRAMLDLIDKGKPYQRHPSYWAPFIVVGEGAPPRS